MEAGRRLPIFLLAHLLAAVPLAAQVELAGTVTEVRDLRARVELDSDLVPAAGDTVKLASEIEGLGAVPVDGTWKVTEVAEGFVWIEPVGSAPRPAPGYGATVFAADPVASAGGGDGGARDPASGEAGAADRDPVPAVRTRWREDFSVQRLSETDGSYCRTRYRDGGFAVRNVNESGGSCRLNLRTFGTLPPRVRISVTTRHLAGDPASSHALVFGIAPGPVADYFALLVDGEGEWRMNRYRDGWADLMPYASNPAVEAGPGSSNRLTVELAGRSIRYWVNGAYLGEHRSDRDAGGGLGVYVSNPGAAVLVDDLVIEELPGAAPPRASFGEAGERRHFDDFETPEPEYDDRRGDYCHTDYVEGWFAVRTAEGVNNCHWNLNVVGSVDRPFRYVARTWWVDGERTWGYGLKFGNLRTEDSNYLVFLISGDGSYKLGGREDGEWVNHTDWVDDPVVRSGLGARNELAVEVHGREVAFYVNGERVGRRTLDRDAYGYVGYYLNEPGHEVRFDDVTLELLEGER